MKFGVDLDAYQLGGMAGKSSQFDDDDEDDEDDNDDHDFGIKTNSRFNGANWDYFQVRWISCTENRQKYVICEFI